MSGLDAIIFDLGGVLVHVDEARGRQRMATRTGKTPEEIERYYRSTPYATELALGKLTGQAFCRIVARDLGFDGTFEEFAAMWSEIFSPIDSMIGLAMAIQLPRAILSNTNALHAEYIFEHFPSLRDFDARVLSHEVGLLKPDPAIYRLALQRCGVEAERTLFVDDLPANVEGARAVGMQAIQFENADQVRQELTNLGVSPI